jgi:hypothetical protein
MSKHREEFSLPLPVPACLAACERAASSPGWRITERQAAGLVCLEASQAAFGFTNPATVSITLADAGGATRVTLSASNFGFGPMQSSHVREQAQRLRGQIEREASRASAPPTQPAVSTRSVYVNGVQLSDAQLEDTEQTHRVRVPDGRYWYDPVCGAWGLEGGPQQGIAVAGLALGGPLRADASGGSRTGIFVNGRELHPLDVAQLIALTGNAIPGRWWVDAQGNFGLEGWPMMGNLFAIARGRMAGPGGQSNEVVSQSGWLVSDGGFIGFQGSIGSGVSGSIGG